MIVGVVRQRTSSTSARARRSWVGVGAGLNGRPIAGMPNGMGTVKRRKPGVRLAA